MSNTYDMLVQVALFKPLPKLFDYLVPKSIPMPSIGQKVLVPFGKNNAKTTAFVMGYAQKNSSQDYALKSLVAISDFVLPNQSVHLAFWLSRYYHHPIGEVLSCMLVPALKSFAHTVNAPIFKLSALGKNALNDKTLSKTLALTGAQKKALQLLHTMAQGDDNSANPNISKVVLNNLQKKGLVEIKPLSQPLHSTPSKPLMTPQKTPQFLPANFAMNDEQKNACTPIINAIDGGYYQAFLLYGVTGSGKTEVYLQCIAHALQKGKQVLVLVPEIGLTPQTAARFSARFNATTYILHSSLSTSARIDGYFACLDGRAQIVIATRSAILYGFKNLGLIIIDEAHDGSYKQHDHLRYHACHVATYIAFCQNIPIVQGSATPDVSTLHACDIGKFTKLTLQHRAVGSMPTIHLIDKKQAATLSLMGKPSHLSAASIAAIQDTLKNNKQVLVFINRRGYAPVYMCNACGSIIDCPHCSAHMVVHKPPMHKQQQGASYLKCHHCHYSTPILNKCPTCNSPNIAAVGAAASSITEQLHSLFGNAQSMRTPFKVLQIDKDTTYKKDDWDKVYNIVNTGQPMILVGTQMLAKGHHFDNIALVVIADIDSALFAPSVFAPLDVAQNILQVAGRAARGGQGRVLIETLRPDNPFLQTLIKKDYLVSAQSMLAERKMLNYPPFSAAAIIQADAAKADDAKIAIVNIKNTINKSDIAQYHLSIFAPLDAPMPKKNKRYFCQMLILAPTRKQLQQFLSTFWPKTHKKARLMIDIDPISW